MTATSRIGPLFTDLYELTMAASYFDNSIFSEATFSVFVRDNLQFAGLIHDVVPTEAVFQVALLLPTERFTFQVQLRFVA